MITKILEKLLFLDIKHFEMIDPTDVESTLRFNMDYFMSLDEIGRAEYQIELIKRRNKVHEDGISN
jgi:hypothetical protein